MGGSTHWLRRNWRSVFIGFTIVSDLLFISLSALVALVIHSSIPNLTPLSMEVFLGFTFAIAGLLVCMGMLFGLYRMAYHASLSQQFFLAGRIYIFSVLLMLAAFYLVSLDPFPRRFMLIFLSTIPVFFVVGRLTLNRLNLWFQKKGFGVHNVLIAGYENGGMNVFHRFTGLPELGYVVKGLITKNEYPHGTTKWRKKKLRQYPITELPRVVKQERIDGIFIPSPKFITNGYAELVDVCRKERIKIKVLSPEADRILRIARLYEVAGITIYSPPRENVETMKKFFKRSFDIVGSLLFIILLSPVFVLTAVAIYLESGFPIIFRQKRAAIKGGRWFYFYKFRSMVKNADELKESLFDLNESDGALFKLRNDPRLTRVGRFIRKYSIDELPQLFNVLKGDMSLVGPRPLPISDFNKVKEGPEFWEAIKDRGRVKPGMTGLWQICGRSTLGFREMVLLDLSYVENYSLLFDLEILVGTIPVVIFGKGAY